MIFKYLLKSLLISGFLLSWNDSVSSASETGLESLLKSRESIVSIHALIDETIQPTQQPMLDSKTGRVVVARRIRSAERQRSGAGVIIHPSGLIVTNIHIIRSAKKIAVILHDGTTHAAAVLNILGPEDLALLKIDPPFPLKPIEFADSNEVHLGDDVVNIGHSQLLKETISGGRIIGLGTSLLPGDTKESVEMIKINMSLYRGDSGGPVLDKDGRLIGIIVAKQVSKEKAAFAIPSNKIKKLYLHTIK